jgi:hypothetical protein
MALKSSEVTPWDEDFEPSSATAITASAWQRETGHRPLDVLYNGDATLSALRGPANGEDVDSKRPATALRLHSYNSSESSNPSTSTESTSTQRKPRRQSTKSTSTFNSSADTTCKTSISEKCESVSETSRSSEALDLPKKKRTKGLFSFLTVKEPSTKAFEEYAEQQRRELKERGIEHPFGVSSKRLPPDTPKVNSKWDGLPDDKRELIKAMDKQRKREQERNKRRSSTGSDNVDEESLYPTGRYYSPQVPSSRMSHATRPSTGSIHTFDSSTASSEAYKTCDPKSRGPRARRASGAPSLTDSVDESETAGASRMRLNQSPSLEALPEVVAYMRCADEGLTSDSDIQGSPEGWMPKTPAPPLVPSHGYSKSIPIVLPITSPFEDGLHNVAPLAPFATCIPATDTSAAVYQPTRTFPTEVTAIVKSPFAAGEAQELACGNEKPNQYVLPTAHSTSNEAAVSPVKSNPLMKKKSSRSMFGWK